MCLYMYAYRYPVYIGGMGTRGRATTDVYGSGVWATKG